MAAPPRILFVCTANRCRSPLAEAFARAALVEGAADVSSAGFLPGGESVPPEGLRVGAEFGLDLGSHLSTQLDDRLLGSSALVLTMTRHHAATLVADLPALWPRVFTLKQFARWVDTHPIPTEASLQAWLDAEAAERPRGELIGAATADDIVDPFVRPLRVWRAVAREIERDIQTIAAALNASSAATPAP